MSEVRVRTSYPNSISCDSKRLEKIRNASVVRIVDSVTKNTIAMCEPLSLIETANKMAVDNSSGKCIPFIRMTFVPGTNYVPPQPKPRVILRKANR